MTYSYTEADPPAVGIIGNIVLGAIRHSLSGAAAGWAVDGWFTADQGKQVVGAVMFLISVGFSVYDKYKAKAKLNTAVVKAAIAATGTEVPV